ncbi:hypothetical protein FNF31_02897 [Cafeteria roenbergensis]|uniref:Uncharacterized protein n=2 Tax=Cafeteria roenbergensis TaxID=33653 RepID=A0A5A8DDA3_CAFRO|nr:hypothetical protein FNF31_02897 [Cafeteria roenbergensis]KAA0165907.1 hypothetical protein FNF28_03289 [Cafeteria roenbergensis]
MQSSMYHPGEDPQRTMYRVMFWLTIMMNSGLFIWGLAATYFAYNASWTPFPLALLGLFSVLNVGFYGDYAMNRRVKSDMYRFLTIQYFLSAFTLIIAAFAFVQIDQGKAYIADNWPIMSQQVIPFTTQLNQQRLFASLQNTLSWLGWFSALVALPQMQRAFELLDEKFARFALNPFRVLVPQLSLIFVIAVITATVGADASIVSTYGNDDDESALIFTIVTAYLFIIAIPIAIAAAWILGTHHTTYTIVWILFSVLTVFALFGGSILSAQAADIEVFTVPRWDYIRIFVPNSYQQKPVQVYVRDAETLLRGAGLGGVMLFIFGLILVLTSMHSAFLIAALAPSVGAGPDAIHHATASLRGSIPASGSTSQDVGKQASGYYGALVGEEGGPDARPKPVSAASGDEEDRLGDVEIVESDDEEDDIGGGSAHASKAQGVGSYQAGGVGGLDGSAMERGRSTSGFELPATGGASEGAALTPRGGRGGYGSYGTEGSANPGYGAATTTAVAADSAVAHYGAVPPPEADTHTPKLPSWGEYSQVSSNLLRRELGSRPTCLIIVGVYVVATLGLLIGALAGLGTAARCGALARQGGFTSTYSQSFVAENNAVINVTNLFPSGRLRYIAYDAYEAGYGNFTVTVSTYSLNKDHIFSKQQVKDAVKFKGQGGFFPDPFETSLVVNVAPLVGDSDAAGACDAADVVVRVPLSKLQLLSSARDVAEGTSLPQRLRDTAERAKAAATGFDLSSVRTTYPVSSVGDVFATSAVPQLRNPAILHSAAEASGTRLSAINQEIRRVDAVRRAAASNPSAALSAVLERLEDPAAVSAVPPVHSMLSRVASGYGPGGAAERLGMGQPLRIGAADSEHGMYFSAVDPWEREAASAHTERMNSIVEAARLRHGSHPALDRVKTAADARSWSMLLDARADAKAAMEAAEPGSEEATLAASRSEEVEALYAEAAGLGDPIALSQQSSVNLRTTAAFVDLESFLLFFPPAISTLNVETVTGPVTLISSLCVPTFGDPSVYGLSVRVRSVSGDVNATTMVGPGIDIETGGDIYSEGVVSALLQINPLTSAVVFNGKGSLRTVATGTGTVTLTQGLGGYDATLATDSGTLLVTNCAGAVGTDVSFTASDGGDIWFTTLLLAGGNITRVKLTGGTFTANVIYSNRVLVDGTAGGNSAILEAFLGIGTLKTGVDPPLTTNYSKPGLIANHPSGSIKVTGIGAAPAADPDAPAEQFTSFMVVDLTTTEGPITVQINGGGFNGPYTLDTKHGQATVELNGVEGPLTGTLGTVSESVPAFGYISLKSDYGDIDMTQLVNSIPDLSALGIVI